MSNSQPDAKPELDLAVVVPLLLKLRDNLMELSFGLQDVLFEMDAARRNEAEKQVHKCLERAKKPSAARKSTN